MSDVEVCFNRTMASIYGRLDLVVAASSLPAPLRMVIAGGVVILGDRVYLREHWSARADTAEQMDRWPAERWVNDMPLRTAPASTDETWRSQLLGWGVVAALSLLGDAAERRCRFDLQAIVSLQSAVGQPDSENPFALGALNLHSVQRPDDDLATDVERFQEPAATLTLKAPVRRTVRQD